MTQIAPALTVAQDLAREGVAYSGEIAAAAARHGVDAKLLAAVAAQETGGPGANAGHNIVGDGGHGHGLFQIDDRFHDFARTAAAMDPAQNADYAAGMISGLLHSYSGDVHKALSAYNAGSGDATGTVTEWMDGQRLGYADSVLRHCAALGEAAPRGSAGLSALPAANNGAESSVVDSLVQQLAQLNALQSFQEGSLAQSDFLPSSTSSAIPSYAQLAGLDVYGHSRYDVSFAGLLSDDDPASGDSNVV